MTTQAEIDFSSLHLAQTARPPVQRRPRFDGDVSELPDRACWALQHLLTRRYISAGADVYSWVLEYRKELSVRLSELDLLLRMRFVNPLPSSLTGNLIQRRRTAPRSIVAPCNHIV